MKVRELIERLEDMPPDWTVDVRVGGDDHAVADLFETPMAPGVPNPDGWVTLTLGDRT